jgi:hypothetical protein
VIIALFAGAAVSSVSVPETAYGHIASIEQVAPAEIGENSGFTGEQTGSSTELAVREYFNDIPVMIEIARCESTFRHRLSDGSILRGTVDSADTGVMQINKRYHQGKAGAMNLDLDNLYDNMAYARYLYDTQGLQPWSSSATCWNRQVAVL